MDTSTIRVSRSKLLLRMAWLMAAIAVIMVTLTAMERTGAESSAAPEPAAVDLPVEELSHRTALNSSRASNSSDGTATIRTGDATAVGVISDTDITQQANVFGGFAIINQSATVVISGTATANTGGNTAIGNSSTNTATSNSSSSAP